MGLFWGVYPGELVKGSQLGSDSGFLTPSPGFLRDSGSLTGPDVGTRSCTDQNS